MKQLMALIIPQRENGTPDSSVKISFLPRELQNKEPCDWRDELKKLAEIERWELKDSDLESIESAIEVLIKNNYRSLDHCVCRKNAGLPGGAILIDSFKDGSPQPVIIVWEEDLLPSCSEEQPQ